jgi:NAD-dependent deacetylase
MHTEISEAAQALVRLKGVVVFTGAGMSVESGIAPFSGKGGIWSRYDPADYGHVDTFRRNSVKAWVLYKDIYESTLLARPHRGHYALANLERRGLIKFTITQNVDGLHQKAGSLKVAELHGNNSELLCERCSKRFASSVYLARCPPLCNCGHPLRPTFVLYGENLPGAVLSRARAEVNTCRILLIIGSSCLVYPAAGLPLLAARAGAMLIEINTEESEISAFSQVQIRGPAGEVLEQLERCLETSFT